MQGQYAPLSIPDNDGYRELTAEYGVFSNKGSANMK